MRLTRVSYKFLRYKHISTRFVLASPVPAGKFSWFNWFAGLDQSSEVTPSLKFTGKRVPSAFSAQASGHSPYSVVVSIRAVVGLMT